MDHAFSFPRLSQPGTSARPVLARAVYWAEAVFRTLDERRRLMQLDERALRDIGLSRADAAREWSRPFWQIPEDR
jgi:uncharacterized protein YjiS (DUF1127 family)